MRSSLVYDVKRSLMRPSTIVTLLLFAVFGAALSYWMFIVMANMYRPVDGAAFIAKSREGCLMAGIVSDRRGEPVRASLTVLSGSQRLRSFSVPGVFVLNVSDLCVHDLPSIEVSTQLLQFNLTTRVSTATGATGVPGSSIIMVDRVSLSYLSVYGSIDGYLKLNSVVILFKVFAGDLKTGAARLYAFALNMSSPGFQLTRPLRLDYAVSLPGFESVSEAVGPRRVDGSIIVDDYVKSYTIQPKTGEDLYLIRLYAEQADGSDGAGLATTTINYWIKVTAERSYIDYLMGSAGLELFTTFFPVAVLYLAYILLAKPRSSGALEFVLARPVTRLDLYFSRYAAGAITTAISSAIFIVVIAVLFPVLLGVGLDAWSYVLLYLGTAASLVTFFTLCYTVASAARSGIYLAISIGLFLVLSVLWNIVVVLAAFTLGTGLLSKGFAELTYSLSYLNPLRFQNFARYFVTLTYGATQEVPTANPALCLIVPILWNITLLAIGYYSFKKVNLTS